MLDGEGGDLESALLEHDLRRLSRGDREGLRDHRRPRGRGDLGTMVAGAVARVEGVGLVEAGDDPLDPRRADHPHRAAIRVGDPALQVDRAEPADVIRVVVGEQDRRDSPRRELHAGHRLRRALPSVDEEDPPVRDHRRAGVAALPVRQRGARADDREMQALAHARHRVRGDERGQPPFDRGERKA